jgi:hypothetical protein
MLSLIKDAALLLIRLKSSRSLDKSFGVLMVIPYPSNSRSQEFSPMIDGVAIEQQSLQSFSLNVLRTFFFKA